VELGKGVSSGSRASGVCLICRPLPSFEAHDGRLGPRRNRPAALTPLSQPGALSGTGPRVPCAPSVLACASGTFVHFVTYQLVHRRAESMNNDFKNEAFSSFEPNPIRHC